MNIPPEILNLLKTEKFCSLATCYQDHPHVSLMNFTYLEEEALIILSSREDTTKVNHIKKNPAVAVLFFNLGNNGDLPLSCTLYGTAAVIDPDKDRFYRESHYKKNNDMGKFILEENISVITVSINQAVLSDVEDSVRTWSAENDLL